VKQQPVDLSAVMGTASGDGGIAHGRLLVSFAESVVLGPDARLAELREEIRAKLGVEALVDASGVCGLFNAIDRIADATGIPLEPDKAAESADYRAELGINRFAEGRA
jgi:hypothetical protein